MARIIADKKAREFAAHIKDMLFLAHEVVNSNKSNLRETTLINKNNEASLEIDIYIENRLIDYVDNNALNANVFSEECGFVNRRDDYPCLFVIDPLDGSVNFRLGQGLLPFGTIITVYKKPELSFVDILAAGIIEHTSGRGWICDNINTYDLDGNLVSLDTEWPLDPSTPVYFDLYTKHGFDCYLPLPRQLWVRSTGCLAGNLHYLLSNITPSIGGLHIKAEEAGALYALVTRSQGLVANVDGQPIANNAFSQKADYSVIAGNPKFTEFMIGIAKSNCR